MEDIELYTFYYDETFHDRKIKIDSEGNMHALNKDNVENYIGVFWGCKQEDIIINKKILEKFEENVELEYNYYKLIYWMNSLIQPHLMLFGVLILPIYGHMKDLYI